MEGGVTPSADVTAGVRVSVPARVCVCCSWVPQMGHTTGAPCSFWILREAFCLGVRRNPGGGTVPATHRRCRALSSRWRGSRPVQEEQVWRIWHGCAASGGVWVAECSARAPKRPSSAVARGPFRSCCPCARPCQGADGGCHALLAWVRGSSSVPAQRRRGTRRLGNYRMGRSSHLPWVTALIAPEPLSEVSSPSN